MATARVSDLARASLTGVGPSTAAAAGAVAPGGGPGPAAATGAGRLPPTGMSAPTRHVAVTDDRALIAAAAAIAYLEDQ